jgi:hypothetical protein
VTQHRDQDPFATVRTAAPETAPARPKLEISATTITTGVVASTASALLGSTLGVAGTLVGAALGAIAYALVAALYSHSVAAAKYRVHELRARTGRGTWPDWADSTATGDIPEARTVEWTVIDPESAATEPSGRRSADGREAKPVTKTGGWNWRPVLAGALGAAFAFALALVLVTGIESVKGGPLSGGTAGGLTVWGGSSQGSPDVAQSGAAGAQSDAPTTNVTSAVTRTSTATSTATETATSTATSTATETATETATQTATATETAVVTTTPPEPPSTSPDPAASSSAPAAPTSDVAATTDSAPATPGQGAPAP